jgi:hypothetical protein
MAKNNLEKQGESTEYLLAQARAAFREAKRGATRPPESAMYTRREFTVVKPFKNGESQHQPGDIVELEPSQHQWAIKHHFITLPEVWAAGKKANALKRHIEAIEAKEANWRQALQIENRAAQALESLRYQLEAATEAIQDAKASSGNAEAELRAVLDKFPKDI